MPESKGRKAAEDKATAARSSEQRTKAKAAKTRKPSLESRGWVAPTFVTVGLVGVLWLVLYYIASPYIPFMATLGGWNVLLGMGLMTASFAIATQWK